MSDIRPPIINQTLTKKWVFYASTKLGDDLFYLNEFIQICFTELGENNIVELLKNNDGANKDRLNKIGNNWASFMKHYRKVNDSVSKAKVLYDRIENKTFSKIESKDEKNFLNFMKNLNLIQQDFYSLAVFLLEISPIRGQTITSQDWKLVENLGLKKLEVTPRRPMLMEGGGSNEQNDRRLDK